MYDRWQSEFERVKELVEKKAVTVHVQNLSALKVNYYQMDIELLFSRQPFVQQQSEQFSFIKPNRSRCEQVWCRCCYFKCLR